MPVRRTELRDELTALIAAGRELSPDHDQALAEVFIDRVASGIGQPSRIRHAPTVWATPRRLLGGMLAAVGVERFLSTLWVKPRRLLGAVILGLACLGGASVLNLQHTSPAPLSVHPMPMVGKVPVVPPAPKVPSAPQAPAPKSAP